MTSLVLNNQALKCCDYFKHFDQIHHNIGETCLVEVSEDQKENRKLTFSSKKALLLTDLVHPLTFQGLLIPQDLQ